MSPLFGHRDENQTRDNVAALQAETERLDALSLPALAAEVMTKGFGPGGPGADDDNAISVQGPNISAGPTIADLALEFAPAGNTKGADDATRLRLQRLVAEGIQVLEHAGLIRTQMHTEMNGFDFALTRRGRDALQSGDVEGRWGRAGDRTDRV